MRIGNNEIKKDNQSSYRAMAILKVCLKYNKYAMERPRLLGGALHDCKNKATTLM